MRIFTETETAQALPYQQLVPAVARAMRELAGRQISAPERQVVPLADAGVLLSMPAIAGDIGVTKLITVHPDNARHGLAAIQGEVIVFDAATGRRLALLNGPTVTARRTAAVSLLGIETLAPRKPTSALIIGTGTQAAAHADALIAYFGVSTFWIAARNPAKAASFCSRLQAAQAAVTATPVALDTLAAQLPAADLVIAATTSKTPVVPATLPDRVMAIGVGAFRPDMAELPQQLLQRRQIVVDDLAGARHEAGDLLQAQIDWPRVRPLSDYLLAQSAPGSPAPLFKTVGQAAWDLAAARVALDAA